MAGTTAASHHEEEPPFALAEHNSPQHLFVDSPIQSPLPRSSPQQSGSVTAKKVPYHGMESSHAPTPASPPGLIESVMTDGSSSIQSDSQLTESGFPQFLDASSTYMLSSLPTIASAGDSTFLSNKSFSRQPGLGDSSKPNFIPTSAGPATAVTGPASTPGSVRFSQLMRAADDTSINVGQSRMPVVPENETIELSSQDSFHSGTLISPPGSPEGEQIIQGHNPDANWLPNFLNLQLVPTSDQSPQQGFSALGQPLLPKTQEDETVVNAKARVKSYIEDDTAFEVSMDIEPPYTARDVIDVIANPELLKVWCDPIQTLIVTSSSDNGRESSASVETDRDREYEGEWIEATTTALESPASGAGYIFTAGQSILETLGFAMYGKITMFVERRRGVVSLTVGPFSGGIHASHTISVFEDDSGRVRVVDRVRLTQEDEVSISGMFLCGVLNSCFSACLLPSVGSYMDQVTTSMARLTVLVEKGQEIISAPPTQW